MHTISATTDGIKRSRVCNLNKFPIKDFLETQTHTGFESVFSLLRFDITSMSRIYHGRSTIFVKKGFLPFARKKPTDGSTIIFSGAIPVRFAIKILSLKSPMVPKISPDTGVDFHVFPPYAPIITGSPEFATTCAIFLSYFKPDISLMASTPSLIASLATSDLGVSTEIDRGQLSMMRPIA